MMKAILIFCVLSIATNAYSIDLDAPPSPKTVTNRSEIERGASAALTCLGKRGNQSWKVWCVGDILQKEKINNTDTDGFKLGASYVAWSLADISSTIISADKDSMYDLAKAYYKTFHKIQLEFGIKDKDIGEMCHFGNDKTLQRLNWYSNQQ